MSVVNYCEASSVVLVTLHEMLSASQFLNSDLRTSENCYFKIERVLKSESAWILFVRSSFEEKYVVKLLCAYEDTRYKMSSIQERQKCQVEALEWNKKFSPRVYCGLARVSYLDVQQKNIVLDEPIFAPEQKELDPSADYALIMHQLPKESQLDVILDKEGENFIPRYGQPLVHHIAQIHEKCQIPDSQASEKWGSHEQLQKKLKHNLALADPVLKDVGGNYPEEFKVAFFLLKERMHQDFPQSVYKYYFEQRIQKNYIKRCHGDLKAPNIWIEAEYSIDEPCVSLLDAIDFNPTYCNIDTLSDFATLVADIQARTKSETQAQSLLELYLRETHQEDDMSRAIVNYYLFEKAYVGAAISIVYDAAPELGRAYLSVAKQRQDILLQSLIVRA